MSHFKGKVHAQNLRRQPFEQSKGKFYNVKTKTFKLLPKLSVAMFVLSTS